MPTINIKDLIEVVTERYCKIIGKDPKSINIKVIGTRLNEKLNEELISPIEFPACYEIENMYIIYPDSKSFVYEVDYNIKKEGAKVNVDDKFNYTTEDATPLTKDEIGSFLKKNKLI